ncbi:hypothetical protein DPMN_025489 [Dreissena polymorpha]|uniref:Uncharacterized protein n=1 Tax=Dreissena polymorpha TaxID=45954 RepID=A0A9D4LPD7_DREPO|nr:hypothetical protein DPMN_025489 [Dreissena polymorpha]
MVRCMLTFNKALQRCRQQCQQMAEKNSLGYLETGVSIVPNLKSGKLSRRIKGREGPTPEP